MVPLLTRGDLEDMAGGDFSGVVSVREGKHAVALPRGVADRRTGRAIETSTRFATASAAKTITALIVLRLVEAGTLELESRAAPFAPELPQLHPEITVQHLLEHTSGMGDYLPEDDVGDIDDFFLPIPVDELTTVDALVPMLDLPPTRDPDEPFRYNNGGYVLLALVAERAAGRDYFDLAQDIFDLAGMERSGFFRSDALPPDTALGYLASGATNERNLPVRGAADGGLYLTIEDAERFWTALERGLLISDPARNSMTTVRQSDGKHHYGWGLWLNATGTARSMEGMDAGVSFRSTRIPARDVTYTVISNTTEGAWPVLRELDDALLGELL